MSDRVYCDYAATTPISPRAVALMRLWGEREFGNPSSLHEEGRAAKAAIDDARNVLSQSLGCLFAEVIFTSGGTESCNLAILGAALANQDHARKRILFSAVEHHCVLNMQPVLQRLGYRVQHVGVDTIGRLRLDELEAMLGPDVLLVSVMHANNELGTIQPAREVGAMARQARALFHCDASQTFLTSNWTPEKLNADLLSLSGHKVGGPKGVGALYIRAGVKISPTSWGGGQEREMRAGTENVAGIVGFGAAVRSIVQSGAVPRAEKMRKARDAFLGTLDRRYLGPTVPDPTDVLPGHAHIRTKDIDAETMLILLDRMGVSASSGAACSSGSLEPSHVMMACGFTRDQARQGLRFSFGPETTEDQAKKAAYTANRAALQILSER